MARFVWRLQRILDVKKRLEDAKRMDLLRIANEIAQARAVLWAQQRLIEQGCRQIAHLPPSERPRQQEFFIRYVQANDERISQIKAHIQKLQNSQRQIASQLLEIRRSRQALERLKERAMQRFLQDQRRFEQKQLDEMASIRFIRQGLAS